MPTPVTPLAATSVDRSEESATTALYRGAIGPVSTGYYLPIFTRFEASDRAGASWNWAASACTLSWLIFRQLWAAALMYAGALASVGGLVWGLGHHLFQWADGVEMGLLAALGVLLFVLPGLFGNALLHAASRKKMALALSSTNTLQEACALLARQASTRQRLLWLVLANVALFGALADGWQPPAPAAQPVAVLDKPLPVTQVPAAPVSAAPISTPALVPAPAASRVALPEPVTPPPEPSAKVALGALAPELVFFVPRRPPTPAADPLPAPALAVEPAPVFAAAPAPTRQFYVNVGLFAQDANARTTYNKLLDAELPAFTQVLQTAKGKRTRVRVGPFNTRSEATAVMPKIRTLKLDAVLAQDQ